MRTSQTLLSITLTAFALAMFAGCATDPAGDDDPTSMTEQDLTSNQHAAFNYFVARGLTKRQSAGIVGNLIQESSVIPTAVEFGGGPGRGIAQWSVGGRWNVSHHDNMTWYAAAHHVSRWGLNPQLGFTWYELHTFGGYGLAALRRTTTIRGATITFERDFEKCGNCQEATRIKYATQVYNAFAGRAAPVTADDPDDETPDNVKIDAPYNDDPDFDESVDAVE
jgi:tail lysozyme